VVIRNVFSKNGGNLGEVGCVDWIRAAASSRLS
jgi:transcriptional/translational regulatory protein YebC/TACO1